jgi:YcxB-like protein
MADDLEHPDPLEFRYRLEASDVASVTWLQLSSNRGFRLMGWCFVLFVPLVVLVQSIKGEFEASGLLQFLTIYAGSYVLVFQVLPRLGLAKLPEPTRDVRVSVSESGIQVGTAEAVTQVPWDGIARARRTRSGFDLRLRSGAMQFFPKRALTEEQASTLTQWLSWAGIAAT